MKRFKKSQIFLKEDVGDNASEKATDAVNAAKTNSTGQNTVSLNSLDNNSSNGAPDIKINAKSATATQDARNIANATSNVPSMKGATVTFVNGESKKSQPVLEGITFTKRELSNFLRSL